MTAISIDSPGELVREPRERTHLWRESLVLAGRNVQHIRQIPEKLLDVTMQPLMFVLLFAYVFGGAIEVPGSSYREFLVGGILLQSIAFGMMGPATAIATDFTEGVIDRFRSLPIARPAYLVGHFLSELAGMALMITILLLTGLIVGWRVHTDIAHVGTAFLLITLFASAIVWLGTLVGLSVRSPDAVMGIGFTAVFPMTFLSNAFVPIDTLPSVLRTIAAWNPVSVLVAAVRELFGNQGLPVSTHSWPLDHPVAAGFGYCVLLLAVAVPLTLRKYARKTSD